MRILLLCLFLHLFTGCIPKDFSSDSRELTLATTTSTVNSGLMSILIPEFEKKFNIRVNLISQGSGAALDGVREGLVDCILVHARKRELELVSQGFAVNRRDVMFNDYVIVGPKSDPFNLRKKQSVLDVFRAINKNKLNFISRGDRSGTHFKELSLWKDIGISTKQNWYKSSKTSMLKTLQEASNSGAYALTDRSTFIFNKKVLDLEVIYEGDDTLYNYYGVLATNPMKHKHVKFDLAMTFIDYIMSKEGQELIKNYGIKRFGKALFFISELN